MEIVGVIQYRLVGNHPAAQGRNATISFSGETISLSEVLAKLIRDNTINESRYKLDVVRLTSPPGSSVTTTEPVNKGTILQNYDRITVNISTLQLQEALATAEEAQQRDEERREREGERAVEATADMTTFGALRRLEDEHGAPSSMLLSAWSAAGTGADPDAKATAQDTRELERATRVAARRFPVAPGKIQESHRCSAPDASETAEAQLDMVCDLCDLPPFEPRTQPCCGSVVCSSCYESAILMTSHEGECPVCGRSMATATTSAPHREIIAQSSSGAMTDSYVTKTDREELKLFARPRSGGHQVPITTHLASSAAADGASREGKLRASPLTTPSSRTVPGRGSVDAMSPTCVPPSPTGAALATAAAEREGTLDALTRPPCPDGELFAYERKLQQRVPTIARFLVSTTPPAIHKETGRS